MVASQAFNSSFFPVLKRLNVSSADASGKPVLSPATLLGELGDLTSIEILILDKAFVFCLADIDMNYPRLPVRMPHLRVIWIRDYLPYVFSLFLRLHTSALAVCGIWVVIYSEDTVWPVCTKVQCPMECDVISQMM